MKFSEIVNQAVTLLHESQRITYRALKREFNLDEDALEDLKSELIEGRRVAADEGDKVLVWKSTSAGVSPAGMATSPSPSAGPSAIPAAAVHSVPEAERRQLTVLF